MNEKFNGLDGIFIAPGFGDRGIEGKILAAQFARKNNIPTLGVCLGMQIMAIEFARNVLGFENAESTEFNTQTEHPVINLMEEQKNVSHKGGTMRLGNWKCSLKEGSQIRNVYKQEEIEERHRHRYEFNNDYLENFEQNGFIASGVNSETGLVEILESENHHFYIGVQFHPEYRSTVENPHPLFQAFVSAVNQFKTANHLISSTKI